MRNARTGKLRWSYDAKHAIRHNAIAVGGGRVYLIDRPLAPIDDQRFTDEQTKADAKRRTEHAPGLRPDMIVVEIPSQRVDREIVGVDRAQEGLERAIDEVTATARTLIASLVTTAEPKNRDVEAARARERYPRIDPRDPRA